MVPARLRGTHPGKKEHRTRTSSVSKTTYALQQATTCASREDPVAPQLELVVEAGSPMRAGLVHHAPSALRHVRVLGAQHEPLLEPRERGVSHVLETRELGLRRGREGGQWVGGRGKDSSSTMAAQ